MFQKLPVYCMKNFPPMSAVKISFKLIPIVCVCLLGYACQDDHEVSTTTLSLPDVPYSYNTTVGDNIPTLGRVLFYDKQLSINNAVSCSSCHKQALAFADNVAFSQGFDNLPTKRNSMPIQNLGAIGSFGAPSVLFWDGRESNLESMVLRPIVNHVEMGINDMDKLAYKLSTLPYYKKLFMDAYGSESIDRSKIANALSVFLSTINSVNTKFDKSKSGSETLSALEDRGHVLFSRTYNCNGCHFVDDPHGYIFAGTFANIGLDVTYADDGLKNVTGNDTDAGKFRIPSLRNVAFTAPYMHDGRFKTLEEVIDHYSSNINDNPNLDPRLRRNGVPMEMQIPAEDKAAIIAFLQTLSDPSMLTDPKFSNPFSAR
jgi:cytochrome c peroxidase